MKKTNKTVIITGAGRGIGRYAAGFLLEKGCHVALLESDTTALDETRAEFSRFANALPLLTDISKEKEVRQAIDDVASRFGRVDVLVNNAAIAANQKLEDLDLASWNRVIEVNLTGPYLCAKYCRPLLAESKGCIINICSTRAFMSEPNTEAYSASKGGLFALTHALAVSLGPEIRVNAISPGWIDVSEPAKNGQSSTNPLTPDDHRQHPAGRVGKPSDIARTIEFLMDPSNDFITGQNFIIDGGMTRKMIYN